MTLRRVIGPPPGHAHARPRRPGGTRSLRNLAPATRTHRPAPHVPAAGRTPPRTPAGTSRARWSDSGSPVAYASQPLPMLVNECNAVPLLADHVALDPGHQLLTVSRAQVELAIPHLA